MRLTRLFFLMLVTSLLCAQEIAPTASIRWTHVLPRYRSFDEIKPTLVNEGRASIFLSRLYPNGFARLERSNGPLADGTKANGNNVWHGRTRGSSN